ncbi:MAG TPA: DUF1501 domain-containing protein [Pirellulales bacterium]|jgi:hypothetical protein|nr:DUF1501 domain-containing protein [Pirellulales bacterium]
MNDEVQMTKPCLGPVARRTFLTGGLGGLLSLCIPRWQAMAAVADAKRRGKSCILLWMNGGPSHLDTFDPKPGTATGGPFEAISTSAPGVKICEHLPLLAEQARHLAIIRSMTSKEGNHDRGQYLMHTGYAPSGTLKHPSLGSWVSHELGDPNFELPNFVSIRGPSISSGFLGVQHNPFTVQDPNQGVRNLPLAKDVDRSRFSARREALAILQDGFRAETHAAAVANHDAVYDKSVRLMQSSLVKAFNIKDEPRAVQQAYGDSDFGRGCLMARRLIETGVRFVEVTLDGWDTHIDNFTKTTYLMHDLDPAFAALIRDLEERHMLDDTLIVWMGEFGRTPKISPADGRDHYPNAWATVLAGGGVRGGQAFGSTDAEGARVASHPVTVPDYFATIARLLGMDPKHEEISPVGRPIAISDGGKPIAALIG